MTACSGSGIFELATTAVKDELNCGLLDGDPPFKVFLSGVMIIRASHSHCHRVIDSDMDKHMTSNCFHLPVLELNVSFSAPKN